MKNLKTFENYIDELDPYGEENWDTDNGKMAILLILSRHINSDEVHGFRDAYAITDDKYYLEERNIFNVKISRIPREERTDEQKRFLKLSGYLYERLGDILNPRRNNISLVGLLEFMKNKGYEFIESRADDFMYYKLFFYNKEEIDRYIEYAKEFAENQKS